jgi:hypothetical protein
LDKLSDARYKLVYDGLANAINIVIKSGKKVILILDNPSLLDPTVCIPRTSGNSSLDYFIFTEKVPVGCEITLKEHLAHTLRYREIFEKLASLNSEHVVVYDMLPHLCDDRGVCAISKEGKRLYSYSDHISNFSAENMGSEINRMLESR